MPVKRYGVLILLLMAGLWVSQEATARPGGPAAVRARVQRDQRDRRRRKSIGSAYKKAGLSVGRGAKRFAVNLAKGKPLKAGKELGKGMGGFGKHTGKGTARIGKKIGRTAKRAVS